MLLSLSWHVWARIIHPYWVAAWLHRNPRSLFWTGWHNLSCARTSIKGQVILGCESSSLAMNAWAMSQYPAHCDAALRCARTSMIGQQKLQLCYQLVSQYLITWQNYSILPSLTILPLGLTNIQWSIGHMDMYSSLSGAPGLRSNASKSCSFATSKQAVWHILPEVLNFTQRVSMPNGIGQCAGWSVRNGSGKPTSSPGFDWQNGLVQIQTRPKPWPTLSWRGDYPGQT